MSWLLRKRAETLASGSTSAKVGGNQTRTTNSRAAVAISTETTLLVSQVRGGHDGSVRPTKRRAERFGANHPVIPTDPLLYRFHEILQVYGLPLKDVIQEKSGDGIMSVIDFTLSVNKVEDPKGDRVLVTTNGKFLPYRKW